MSDFLSSLLAAGLIEKLEGDDHRFEKLENAATALAGELRSRPLDLISSVLAGVDPDVPADDPAITRAQNALVAEWKSMRSVHADPPVGLLRAVLLDACRQAGEGSNAAVLWLTLADTLRWKRLGREEAAIRPVVDLFARRTEEKAMHAFDSHPSAETPPTAAAAFSAARPKASGVDRAGLLSRVRATAGPQDRNGTALPSPNPHWTNAHQSWSYEFGDRMGALLADELDSVAKRVRAEFAVPHGELIKRVNDAIAAQGKEMHGLMKCHEVRLAALWWSKALYSPSMGRSYREMPTSMAAIVMAVDLLNEVTKPAPASVGYLLAESIRELPDAALQRTLAAQLAALREARGLLPAEWTANLTRPPEAGRLTLRDLVVLALGNQEEDIGSALGRAGFMPDLVLDLPTLGHAVYRQEQAVQIASAEAV